MSLLDESEQGSTGPKGRMLGTLQPSSEHGLRGDPGEGVARELGGEGARKRRGATQLGRTAKVEDGWEESGQTA